MKVNFDKAFSDCFGKEINGGQGGCHNIAETLCTQLFNLSTLRGTPVPAERKYQAYKLCQRIAANPREVELTTEDCSLLKEVASETYSAGAYGQVVDLIEANV